MKWIVGAVEGTPTTYRASSSSLGPRSPTVNHLDLGLYVWGRVRVPVRNTQSGIKIICFQHGVFFV